MPQDWKWDNNSLHLTDESNSNVTFYRLISIGDTGKTFQYQIQVEFWKRNGFFLQDCFQVKLKKRQIQVKNRFQYQSSGNVSKGVAGRRVGWQLQVIEVDHLVILKDWKQQLKAFCFFILFLFAE